MTARATPIEAETEPERAARLAWESRQLDEVREDVRAGRVIANDDVGAWLDRLARGKPPELDGEAPPPSSHAG